MNSTKKNKSSNVTRDTTTKNGVKIERVPIGKLKNNPDNPRVIKDEKFLQLVKSIIEFPQMLDLRPIVVNDDMIVLGGNMRLKACVQAGLQEVPIIRAGSLTEKQQREFIVKDNIPFGQWDFDALANQWDLKEITDWGLDIPGFDPYEEAQPDEPSGYDQQKQWFLNIEVVSEADCQALYERLVAEGLNVKIVT